MEATGGVFKFLAFFFSFSKKLAYKDIKKKKTL